MTTRMPSRSPVEHHAVRRQEGALGFLVGALIALLLAFGWAATVLRDGAPSDAVCEPEKINPNDAPLASLMRLPGVGLTRARAIVDYRNRPTDPSVSRPAFVGGQDMQRIRGFGPATVEDILPWLQFAGPPQEPNRPSDAD